MRLRRGCHAAFAAGRWLFIGATAAGSKSAVRYSLLGSCLQRGLNPREYLHWLFSRLPTDTNQTVAQLTPAAFADLKSQGQRKAAPVVPRRLSTFRAVKALASTVLHRTLTVQRHPVHACPLIVPI